MVIRAVATVVLGLLLGGHGSPPPEEQRASARKAAPAPIGQAGGAEPQPIGRRPTRPIVWFTPGPGTPDLLRLFELPDEWADARARLSVFKFYRSQLLDPPDPIVGPNTYEALRSVDAFRLLTQVWHKQIAIEVPAVKEYTCTEGMSGTDEEIRSALKAIRAVRAAGGEVSYLALDEPFTATVQAARCGGQDVTATLDRLERYVANVKLAAPAVEIGLIEQFPISSGDQILGYVRGMISRGIRPAFFHLDADLNALPKGSDRFEREIPALMRALEGEGVPAGIIFFGHSGESDRLYTRDALDFVRRAAKALPDLPRDIVFQSWAESKAGRYATPRNLPEWEPDTHTALIDAGLDVLVRRGGAAVPR